jgi:hypothetical protein
VTIVEKRTGQDGTLWGWDDRQGDWVELDAGAEQGSFLGNVARGIGLAGRELSQGISEVGVPDFENVGSGMLAPTQSFLNREALKAEEAAKSNAAPAATALGRSAPEILATTAMGIATSGMGLVPALAGQAGVGALIGLLRPGDMTERAANAAFGAAMGITGEMGAAGISAAKGILLGTRLGEAVTLKSAGRVGRELDASLTQAKQAERLAGGVAEDIPQAGAVRPLSGEGRSVGAAEAPLNEADQVGLEGLAANRDDLTGARINSRNDQIDRQWAEDQLGYKSPLGAGTHGMSSSRLAEAAGEYTALGDAMNQTYRAGNQKLVSRTAAKALGMEDAATKDVIELDDLALVKGRLANTYDQLERRMPAVSGEDVASVIRPAIKEGGPFDATDVERYLQKAVDKAVKQKGNYSGEEAVNMLRRLGDESTKASAKGDQHGAEMLLHVRQRLNDVLERTAQRQGDDQLVESLRTANTQYRVMKMLEAPGSVSPTRDINPTSLLNKMRRDPVNGGWGSAGPPRGTPEGDLYRLIKLMAKDQTNVPATGVRQLITKRAIGAAAGIGGGTVLGGFLLGGH